MIFLDKSGSKKNHMLDHSHTVDAIGMSMVDLIHMDGYEHGVVVEVLLVS